MLSLQIDLDSTDSAVSSTPCGTCNPDWCRSHKDELNATLVKAEKLRARAARYSGLVAALYSQELVTEVETLVRELDVVAGTLELDSCPITAPRSSNNHH